MSDIVDLIGELVDGQLAEGEHTTADVCWHCGRSWHGLPITERVHEMWKKGVYDENYRVNEDFSRVVCQGSDFIGPMPFHRTNHPPQLFITENLEAVDPVQRETDWILRVMGQVIENEIEFLAVRSWCDEWKWTVRTVVFAALALLANLFPIAVGAVYNTLSVFQLFNVACIAILAWQLRVLKNTLRRLNDDRPNDARRASCSELIGWSYWRGFFARHRRKRAG